MILPPSRQNLSFDLIFVQIKTNKKNKLKFLDLESSQSFPLAWCRQRLLLCSPSHIHLWNPKTSALTRVLFDGLSGFFRVQKTCFGSVVGLSYSQSGGFSISVWKGVRHHTLSSTHSDSSRQGQGPNTKRASVMKKRCHVEPK